MLLAQSDDEGRPVAAEQDGGGHWGMAADGEPDLLSYWTYYEDGSWMIEFVDFTADIVQLYHLLTSDCSP